jgi:hypothetical protein
MRTVAPRKPRKIYIRTGAPATKNPDKRYEDRCSEKTQKKTI